MRYETGMPVEDVYKPTRPPPKHEEREAPPVRTLTKHASKTKEDYKVKHELVLQEAGIRDIIMKIKSEASHAAAERQDILADLDRMKAELRNTRLYDPFAAIYNSKQYRPDYKLSYAGKSIVNNSKKHYDELQHQSKYIVNKYKNEYNEIQSPQVKNQLNRLDEILMTQINENFEEEKEENDEKIVENMIENQEIVKNIENNEIIRKNLENIENLEKNIEIPIENTEINKSNVYDIEVSNINTILDDKTVENLEKLLEI